MGKFWLHETPKYFAKYGVNFTLYPGWELRSRSTGGFEDVRAIGTHHTASSTTPERDTAWQYRNAPARPIGNMLIDREGRVILGAAGASNTQGRGGPVTTSKGVIPKDRGNLYFISIEAANNGTGAPWPAAQMNSYIKVCAALCEQWGLDPLRDIFSHWEWVNPSSPNRKVDPAGPTPSMPDVGGTAGAWPRWNDDAFRRRVADAMMVTPPKPPPPPPVDPQINTVPKKIKDAKMYTTTTPTRVFDTRKGRALAAGATSVVKTNLPKGATAAHVVITFIFDGDGFLSAWGNGNRPNASVLNGRRGQTIANAVTVPLDGFRNFKVYNHVPGQLIVDVMGYHHS